MKRTMTLAIAGLWSCVSAVTPAAQGSQTAPKTEPATHVTKDQIQAFFAQMPPNRILDSVFRAVDVGGYRWVCSR